MKQYILQTHCCFQSTIISSRKVANCILDSHPFTEKIRVNRQIILPASIATSLSEAQRGRGSMCHIVSL